MDDPADPVDLVARGLFRGSSESDAGPLHFEGIRLLGAVPRVGGLANWQIYQGIVLALVFSTGARHQVLGSAVLVGPGVALGADHTVREWIPRMNAGETALLAIGITGHGLVIWHVVHGVCIEGTDISIMRLQLASTVPPTRKFYVATLTTRLPAIGEQMVTAGFVASHEVFEQRLADTLELSGGIRVSSGPVMQHFPQRRDTVTAKYPCLEIDSPLYGGMSGGPVFDQHGGLVALGSRSPELGAGEEPSPMIAGLIWPCLGQPFSASHNPSGPMTSLLEMAGRYAFLERADAVTVERAESGWTTYYAPWT
jgi:Trypsin-like peptidase domain